MIVVQPYAFQPLVLAHKVCGGYVERVPGMPSAYSCPKCNSLLHANNVEQRELPMVV